MAAPIQQQTGSKVSGTGIDELLPTGSCDYRDLGSARALTCGCKRFWLNKNHYSSIDGNNGGAYCWCSHHACFHNATSQPVVYAQASVDGANAPMLESVARSIKSSQDHQEQQRYLQPDQPAGLGIRPGSSSQSRSINSRVWEALNGFAREQEVGELSRTSSRLPSTATPSVIGDSRFGIDQAQHQLPTVPPISVHMAYQPVASDQYSATEIATPSIRGTPDLHALTVGLGSRAAFAINDNERQAVTRPPTQPNAHPLQHNGPETLLRPNVETQGQPLLSPMEMQGMLQGYGRRLELLETLSFSHVPVEEVQEKFDLFDGRLLDLEHWRIEQEGQHSSPVQAGADSNERRDARQAESSFSASDGSFDSGAAAYTDAVVLATLAANAETGPRIDHLESRIADLESTALPSFIRPWVIQVVLLPWGRDLRGIWFSALEATQQSLRPSTQASEDWTGPQSAQTLSFKSTETGAWTTESIQAWADEAQEWLSPKACGPSGMVFERLASRGLVREVTLATSDSRNILRAIENAFGRVLRSEQVELPTELQRYQALHEHFIPLRKVRKSTRLRFLGRSEMITPAMWTASFLDSCAMKVKDGQRRLYITTPMAYLQSYSEHWSWPQLRQLPIYDASGEEQAAQATHAAIEACWTYNDRLDYQASAHSSFASHASQWSMRSQQSAGPQAEQAHAMPPSPHSEARPSHHRTVSMPNSSSAAEQIKAAMPKRRVASFETSTAAQMQVDSMDLSTTKRRRISISPEAERRGVGFTPRLSREPPSPFTSEHAGEARSQATASRKRGTTPFAYATPHSHSNHAAYMNFLGADGDTEADSEIAALQNDRMEDEWQGVEEGEDHGMEQNDSESEFDDHEADEDDLDAGLTIYEA